MALEVVGYRNRVDRGRYSWCCGLLVVGVREMVVLAGLVELVQFTRDLVPPDEANS